MKTPKATKKRIAYAGKFNAGALALARELGAVAFDHPVFDDMLVISTKFGKMTIHAATEPEDVLNGLHNGSFFTVFCRFIEADHFHAAADVLRSNPHSGKNNFHISGDNTEDDLLAALGAFKMHVESIAVAGAGSDARP